MRYTEYGKLIRKAVIGIASETEKDDLNRNDQLEKIQQQQWDRTSAKLPNAQIDKNKLWRDIERSIDNATSGIRINKFLRWAAVIVLVLASACIVYFLASPYDNSYRYTEVSSPSGKRTNVILPDGSRVILAGNSAIRFPEEFDDIKRSVDISGEAFFNVVHKPDQAFIVSFNDVSVEVLGTEFNVSAYPTDSVSQTTLVSGSVKVSCFTSKQCDYVILVPGEMLSYSTISENHKIEEVNTDKIISWIHGKLIFDGDDIYTITRKLERWYGTTIRINDYSDGNDRYTLTLENNTLNEALDLLSKIGPVKYAYDEYNNQVEIVIKKTKN